MLGLLQALRRGKRAPAWAEEEMARIAAALLDIDAEYWRARIRAKVAFERAESDGERAKATSALADAAEEAVDKIPKALGLCRQGYNAFVDLAEARECVWTSLDFGLLEASRFGPQELDRAERVANWHGLSVSAARKQRTRARALKLSRKGKR